MRAAALLAWAILPSMAQTPKIPRFSDYPVTEIFRGKRAALQVQQDDHDSIGFRAVLADANKSPNFAGGYVISKDTCGSDSVRLMITEARSGKVYEAFCMFSSYTFTRPNLPIGVVYRPDSTLLIAHGCFDDDKKPECGNHYYRMTTRALVQIRFVPFSPPVQ